MVRLGLLSFVICLSCCGCSSFKSTLLTRNESNTCWKQIPRLKGVPITVKVPTHLRVVVYEKHFLHQQAPDAAPSRVSLPVVVRDFETEVIRTEKMFTVDFKRPAAGTIDLTAEFNDEQYFKKIQDKITDETISEVSALLQGTLPLLTPTADDGTDQGQSLSGVSEIRSVVAVGVFEFDEPDFEEQVMAFVNCHLNNAHNALMVPPGVEPFSRLPEVAPIASPSCVSDGLCDPPFVGY